MTPSNIDLKALWSQENPTPPPINQLINKAQKYQQQQWLEHVVYCVALVATAVFVGWIWWFYQPEFITTKLGIILVIMAIVLAVGFQSTLLPLLLKENSQLSSKDYLYLLQQLQQKKTTLQTKVLSLYFVLLSAGLGLYFYEYTLKMAPIWAGVAYGATTLWIAFNWWYLRPRIIKKQQGELEKMLEEWQQLEGQLEE